jgi:hypothetical protein
MIADQIQNGLHHANATFANQSIFSITSKLKWPFVLIFFKSILHIANYKYIFKQNKRI